MSVQSKLSEISKTALLQSHLLGYYWAWHHQYFQFLQYIHTCTHTVPSCPHNRKTAHQYRQAGVCVILLSFPRILPGLSLLYLNAQMSVKADTIWARTPKVKGPQSVTLTGPVFVQIACSWQPPLSPSEQVLIAVQMRPSPLYPF